MNNIIKKRSIAFVLSDFNDDGYESATNIAARKHDIIGVKVYDDLEKKLPNVGLIHTKDLETGREQMIDTSSKKVRSQYEIHFEERYNYFYNTFKKSGSDVLTINTKEDYVKHLLKFFKSRHKW